MTNGGRPARAGRSCFDWTLMTLKEFWTTAGTAAAAMALGCSPAAGSGHDHPRSTTGGSSAGGAPAQGGDSSATGGVPTLIGGPGGAATMNVNPVCGNGVVEGSEACDDANTKPGDGCTETCALEPGWICPIVADRCVAATCGDGIVAGVEECDDGNPADQDGCSSTCQREPGWACTAGDHTACHATTCGDGNKEGFEQCDDGNRIPYDGCSPTCTVEPSCFGGTCTAVCGDGLKFPQEDCDDGNTTDGDGCSAACEVESGYACEVSTLAPPDKLTIPILYRDFLYADTSASIGPGHPDFQAYGGDATGLVQQYLDEESRPLFASSTGSGSKVVITDVTSFYWWYHDKQCGDAGCTQNPYAKLVYLDASNAPTTLTLGKISSGAYQFDSSAFFPLDGLGWGNVQTDLDGLLFGTAHNYAFTSELRYVFTYQGNEKFDFLGDDDVYVFINGKLAVDLGGVHGPESGTITLDTNAANKLQLTIGGMYQIAVFQAERHTTGSNYQLTLSGFVHAVSACKSTCGDGVVTRDEVCDDGTNDGRYGGCQAGCHAHGPYCGDGITQKDHGESCDDGNTVNGDRCTSTCVPPIVQ